MGGRKGQDGHSGAGGSGNADASQGLDGQAAHAPGPAPGGADAPALTPLSPQQAFFSRRYQCRELERSHFPALEQLEDFDLVIAIGHHQLRGAALSLKSLVELRIGSPATVQRRLKRLKDLGFVVQSRSAQDHRSQLLSLHPSVLARVVELLSAARP